MSPPLVVAFALAGTVDIDMSTEPLGKGQRRRGRLSRGHLADARTRSATCSAPRTRSGDLPRALLGLRRRRTRSGSEIPSKLGVVYDWDRASTYIQEPPFFTDFGLSPAASATSAARARWRSSATRSPPTTSAPPARSRPTSPAGQYLQEHGVAGRGLQQLRLAPRQRPRHDARHLRQRAHQEPDGARRRGRRHACTSPARRADEHLRRRDASTRRSGMPLDHLRRPGVRHRQLARLGRQGHASARRARRSSPRASSASTAATWSAWACCRCQFKDGDERASAGPRRHRDLRRARPREARLQAAPGADAASSTARTARRDEVQVVVRIDTPIEIEYYQHGGILPYVLRQLVAAA